MGYFSDKFESTQQDMTPEFCALFNTENFVAIVTNDLYKITGGDAYLASSLLHLFKTQAESWMSDFTNAQTEAEKLHAVHAIKGAARCIAANKLAKLAANLEETLRNNEKISKKASFDFLANTANVIHYITSIETKLHI